MPKPRVQRTFAQGARGVKVHLFESKQMSGGASVVENLGIVEGNRSEFGLNSIHLTNNVQEMMDVVNAAEARGFASSFVLMIGTNVAERTQELKKAKKFFSKR
ncbi:hypothetical protein A3K01_00800 [candidate division WWE3 bacterium RIFOXYD1_FULL_43_17]|uniref:Uncharacterized protein n=1 Tax=candidate division WWE3 bacterium RIFOXYD1_FULL_43_17 TaxID=1802652 RepID=A0A1F4XEZ1_UNCKA|nr:MAG: hypothetical protein A3K01_00800 [candidate division WWE3 bacterium RIFOXYD1_FULL_43_17]